MSDYGTAYLQRNYDDGTVTVTQADPVIGVSQELLDQAEPWVFPHGDQETIQLDTAGDYLYRRIGPAPEGYVVVYERIEP